MISQRKGTAVFRHQSPVGKIHIKEIVHHGKGLLRGHYHCFRISINKILNVRRMIRLHMLHHQIIRLAAV